MTASAKFERQRRDWEELADYNPEWAVLTSPDSKTSGWDMDAFFESGREQIDSVLARAAELGRPQGHDSVLDFGCGVGRLAPALADAFGRYVGVDISEGMIERARELNSQLANAEFIRNEQEGLSRFQDEEFDAVVSFLVLQHLPDRSTIRSYLSEMARVLAPGGLIAVQLISHIPLVYRARLRGRLYRLARAMGVSVERAHGWGLQAMRLTAIPEDDVVSLFNELGCETLDRETVRALSVLSTSYLVTKP
jgi:ubiquinone/menaquinone biosynthesis C-methylase UbiE